MIRAACILVSLALAIVGGCAGTQRSLEWLPSDVSIDTIARRQRTLQTYTATGTLRLQRENSQPVVLDAVLLGSTPHSYRMRAWKVGRTVFDLLHNANSSTLWVHDELDEQIDLRDLTSSDYAHFMSPLFWLGGSLQTGEWKIIDETAETATLHQGLHTPTGSIEVVVNKRLHVPIQFTISTDGGTVTRSITLAEYSPVGEIMWPMRITATTHVDRLELHFNDVMLNESLSEEAFTPLPGSRIIPQRTSGLDRR